MTTHPADQLALTTVAVDPYTLRTAIVGDLDYDSAAELLEEVEAGLAAHPGTRDLRLDCGRLGDCDSMGISVLLTVHRRTAAAGVRLHLDERPPVLERLLDLTGIAEFLTADPAAADADAAEPPAEQGAATERQDRRPSAGPPNG
ncbi:anti-anti-sigma factor [Streptomyces sp. DvalAA-14]|uniref:STAS domain-containing protein n=1 Tax=unclassified Streptomyces TaxID=2593676 RepID=UPI00081B987E|nr:MULTISPECIES: STAS domain-containing protein [unclassified Streptomyces]MYS23542.1 STAS domain-containing protein [Streptomyces sp. SID4948]SCE34954.1 anti-anti-sigma factor [Streptomyces sp. DvalAA-14]